MGKDIYSEKKVLIKPTAFGNEYVELAKKNDKIYFRTGFNSIEGKKYTKSKFNSYGEFEKELGSKYYTEDELKIYKEKQKFEAERLNKIYIEKKPLIKEQQDLTESAKEKYNSPRVNDWGEPEKSKWLKLDKEIRELK